MLLSPPPHTCAVGASKVTGPSHSESTTTLPSHGATTSSATHCALVTAQHITAQHGARPYTTNLDTQTCDTQLTSSGKQRGRTAQFWGHVSCMRRTWGGRMRRGAQRKHAPDKQAAGTCHNPAFKVVPIVQATY